MGSEKIFFELLELTPDVDEVCDDGVLERRAFIERSGLTGAARPLEIGMWEDVRLKKTWTHKVLCASCAIYALRFLGKSLRILTTRTYQNTMPLV